ncbi:MAG: hypothetical protein HXX09_16400 [Bacteroidetes bacterium]|nr:hypothetical protein [Bacteroidota bacterium]
MYNFKIKLATLLLLSTIFLCFDSFGQTKYYVNDGSTTGDVWCTGIGNNSAGRGLNPASPKLTLTSLLTEYGAILTPGDTIKIETGTYNNEANLTFNKLGITFLGAGNNLTIIDNLGAGLATNFFMYVTGNNVTFKNLTLQGYENNGTQTPGHSGQALTIGNGATGILVENVILSNNGASGGNPSIVLLANSSATIKGGGGFCNVWKTAYTGGVEVFGDYITLNIQDYILSYNYKTGAYDGGGLLMNNYSGGTENPMTHTTVNITNTKFFSNEASDGGAISQRGGVLNVTDCIIDGNMAGQTSTPIYGAGLRMTGGTATFTRTAFTNNINGTSGGTLRGAAIGLFSLNTNIQLTLNNCYFSGNNGAEGDDIYADKNSAKTVNVFASNTTFSGSADAIFNKDADLIQLTNCGNPTVAGSNSPPVTKVNILAPASFTSPTTPSFTGGCGTIVLPVELTYFNGNCTENGAKLKWQTASEQNNDYFNVEKSYDGVNFNVIGKVNGNGNSNSIINYQFEDYEFSGNKNYYRLTQFDFNGESAESNIIFVQNNCSQNNNTIIDAYFNSENNGITITSKKDDESLSEIFLTDLAGRIVLTQSMELTLKTTLPIPNSISNSIYILGVKNSNQTFFKKILVNKQ